MINVDWIEYTNFQGVASERIDYDLFSGLILVRGLNGASKTTLFLDGPCFLLFGKIPKYRNKAPGKAILKRGEKSMLVRGHITVSGAGETPRKLTITRSRNTKDVPDGLSVIEEGVDVSMSGDKITQAWLDKVVGWTFSSWSFGTCFTSDVRGFTRMTDFERKDLFDEICGSELFERAFETTDALLKELQSKLSEAEKLRNQTESRTETCQGVVDALKTVSRVDLKAVEAELSEQKNLLDRAVAEVDRHETLVEAQQALKKKAKDAYELSSDEFADLNSKKLTATAHQRKVERELQTREARIDHLKGDLVKARVTLQRFIDSFNSRTCHTCGGNLANSQSFLGQATAARDDVANLRENLKKAKEEAEPARKAVEEAEEKLDAITTAVEKAEDKRNEAEERHDEEHDKLADAQKQLGAAEQSVVRIVATRESLEKQLKAPADPQDQLKDARSALNTAKKDLIAANQALKAAREVAEDEKQLSGVFGRNGARLELLRDAIPLANDAMLRASAQTGSGIDVQFSLRGEDETNANAIDILIENPGKCPVYEGSSMGERRLLDVICMFGVMRVAASFGDGSTALYFDEAFEYLSADWQIGVVRILRSLIDQDQEGCKRLFIMSHENAALKTECDRTVHVVNGRVVNDDDGSGGGEHSLTP